MVSSAEKKEVKEAYHSQTEGGAYMRRSYNAPDGVLYAPYDEMLAFMRKYAYLFGRPYSPPPMSVSGGVVYSGGQVVGYTQDYVAPRDPNQVYRITRDGMTGWAGPAAKLTAPVEEYMRGDPRYVDPRGVIYTSAGPMSVAPHLQDAPPQTGVSIMSPIAQIAMGTQAEKPPAGPMSSQVAVSYALYHPTETIFSAAEVLAFPSERKRVKGRYTRGVQEWSTKMKKEGPSALLNQTLISGIEYVGWTAPMPVLSKLSPTALKTLGTIGVTYGAIEMFTGGETFLIGDPKGPRQAITGAFFFAGGAMIARHGFEMSKIKFEDAEVFGYYEEEIAVKAKDIKRAGKKQVLPDVVEEKILRPVPKREVLPDDLLKEGKDIGFGKIKYGERTYYTTPPTGKGVEPDELVHVLKGKRGQFAQTSDVLIGVKREIGVFVDMPKPKIDFAIESFGPADDFVKTPLSTTFGKMAVKAAPKPKPMLIRQPTKAAAVSAPRITGFLTQPQQIHRQTQQRTFQGMPVMLQHPLQEEITKQEYKISPAVVTMPKRASRRLVTPMTGVGQRTDPVQVTKTTTATKTKQVQYLRPKLAFEKISTKPLKPKTSFRKPFMLPPFGLGARKTISKSAKIFPKALQAKIPTPSLGGIFLGKTSMPRISYSGVEIRGVLKKKKKRRKK